MLTTIPHWPGFPRSRQSHYTELNSKKLIGKSSRRLSNCSKPNRTQSGKSPPGPPGKLGNFKRHQTVLLVLGDTDLPKLEITETEIRSQLRKVQNEPDSLSKLPRFTTRDMQDRRGIVYPFRTGTSQEVTPSQHYEVACNSNSVRFASQIRQICGYMVAT